jgi:hypothetical protein|tara:strand:+ start:510 stop:878 length:369 start_codon:yes stop_codon:yes gene_type:complete
MTDYSTETHEHLNANRYRRRLKLPSQLQRLPADKQWKTPGDDILLELVAFITDPLDFLPTFDAMLFNSGPLMGKDEAENADFHEYRGSRGISRDLPWIDAELTIYIAVNRRIGDDVGIALGY